MEKRQQIRLVKKAKQGDTTAFIELCESYQEVIYNSAYKILLNNHDVADCLQETEIKAWQKISQLRNEASFNTWFFSIMLNLAKDILKKREASVEFEEQFAGTTSYHDDENDLTQALNYLSEIYRIPLVLHYYAGFKIQEIAEQLQLSENTVKTRLARGRAKLKLLLRE
ncbi:MULTISPECIES: sigma-70 family RNA polymerase sigma factor [unclassified Enterococcus]|uniref:RNA polymerase sigma factor n=1 Tax=unclassified Enterococcus TaxID=2608891 RepID=UPI00155246AD|nr:MULTISPECIES: sigma-70 family RNA polymerase sigma factor [unclassified Enterococcus]MBS7578365.1 sigma-70 family RNA polymerase sigma factor [Enterococcus sp. MMGLQ5-2]MBS7585549.1 sigma-70 family RNA polymerase sigma factor [Enterococcus sp. MMGLQ5-1]NPD13408.1 sigma-70 family RNA polymerase sigma factor [Enterococcus sp. MMGLQ5-1]NPD38197.1 sigma-70 family RNA polymerase sigma factor [Enterococcus sp. MMGLQ5-2]